MRLQSGPRCGAAGGGPPLLTKPSCLGTRRPALGVREVAPLVYLNGRLMYDAEHQFSAWSDAVRTTLAIDDDVLAAAKHLAERERKSIGAVVSAPARQGLSRGTRSTKTERDGIPLLPSRKAAVPITLELVNQLRDV
jgi:hypothetical protein